MSDDAATRIDRCPCFTVLGEVHVRCQSRHNVARDTFAIGPEGGEVQMVFTRRLGEGIRRGRIRCSVRIWTRPDVRIGGRYQMDDGHIVGIRSRRSPSRILRTIWPVIGVPERG